MLIYSVSSLRPEDVAEAEAEDPPKAEAAAAAVADPTSRPYLPPEVAAAAAAAPLLLKPRLLACMNLHGCISLLCSVGVSSLASQECLIKKQHGLSIG